MECQPQNHTFFGGKRGVRMRIKTLELFVFTHKMSNLRNK